MNETDKAAFREHKKARKRAERKAERDRVNKLMTLKAGIRPIKKLH